MMYNPVVIPWGFSYPIPNRSIKIPNREFGTRIVMSSTVHEILEKFGKGYSPKLVDLSQNVATDGDSNYKYGWCLEEFFAAEVIKCHEGYLIDKEKDINLRRLFDRKSGPIFLYSGDNN